MQLTDEELDPDITFSVPRYKMAAGKKIKREYLGGGEEKAENQKRGKKTP